MSGERPNPEHITRVSHLGGGWGFRCSCGEKPNRSSKQRRVAEKWAAAHKTAAAYRDRAL